jgi:hypothetical protein
LFSLLTRFRSSLNSRLAIIASLLVFLFLAPSLFTVAAQDKEKKKPDPTDPTRKEPGKVPDEQELAKTRQSGTVAKLSPVESIVEIAIIAYGTRKLLETARASIHEEGTIRLATDQGDLTGNYSLRSMRREKTWQDLLRVDLELSPPESDRGARTPAIKYIIGFNGASVWSAQNNQYVTPRPDAEIAFRAQLTHEYMALLRYKEDGSKLELVGPEKVVGVDTNAVDMTNPNGDKTRFWISTKTYRVLHAEYLLKMRDDQPPVKYRVSYTYSPFRVVQNTLVPSRRVMTQDGKFVQEITLNNIVYSAKLDPEIFQHLQEQ